MELFDNTWYGLAASATAILLIASTLYTIRNILKIWRKGKPVPVPVEKDETNSGINEDDCNEDQKPLLEGNFVCKQSYLLSAHEPPVRSVLLSTCTPILAIGVSSSIRFSTY